MSSRIINGSWFSFPVCEECEDGMHLKQDCVQFNRFW